MAGYERVAVPPFENGVGAQLPASAAENVAGALIAKLQKSGRFREVSAQPTNAPGELIVRGKILKYDPGSKALRFLLIGLSPGDLQLELELRDAQGGITLEEFATSGEIIAGGVMGASMGIDDMIDSAVSKACERIDRYAR